MNKDQILDGVEKPGTKFYAKKSFKNFIYCIASLTVILLTELLFFKANKGNEFLSLGVLLLLIVAIVCGVKGMIQGIKSVRNKEDSFWRKAIGLVGNSLVSLLLGLAILTNLYDIIRFMFSE